MRSAKKILLSAGVVVAFVAYSWQQRQADPVVLTASSDNQTDQSQSPVDNSNTNSSATKQTGKYKDGEYTGSLASAAPYGQIQVEAIIKGGKLVNVVVLKSPDSHRNSVFVNSQSNPWLTQEAIKAQSAKIDILSGATESSIGFRESLKNALDQAV